MDIAIRHPDGRTREVKPPVAARLLARGWELREVPTPAPRPPGRVPDAPVEEVLEWVGDDPARAKAALEHEQAKPKPRVGIIRALG